MSLITRTAKGSKLTIAEMDGNLEYLASSSFQDGVYSQITGTGAIIGELNETITYTPPLTDAAVGTYTIQGLETDGDGEGAEFEIEVIDTGRSLSFDLSTFTIINGGSGYATGDVLIIDNTTIGGTSEETELFLEEGSVDDITATTITVTSDQLQIGSSNLQIGITNEVSILAPNITLGLKPDVIFLIQGLPTEDPLNTDQLWNDSGSLKISAGA